jgi:hypothetical protein
MGKGRGEGGGFKGPDSDLDGDLFCRPWSVGRSGCDLYGGGVWAGEVRVEFGEKIRSGKSQVTTSSPAGSADDGGGQVGVSR